MQNSFPRERAGDAHVSTMFAAILCPNSTYATMTSRKTRAKNTRNHIDVNENKQDTTERNSDQP